MSFDGNALFFQKKRKGHGDERENLGNSGLSQAFSEALTMIENTV